MRKLLSLLFVLALACSLAAQIRTGTLYGKISDEEGNPLPGVTLTLTSPTSAPLHTVTSATGSYRFLSLPPGRDYVIKAELGGFKTEIREGIILTVNSNVEINLTMTMGRLEEEVTVRAVSPVVDSKKTAVGVNVTQEALQSLPTARDPWVVLQMAPSIIVDRENVGGVESGQQSSYVARGAGNYNNNVWAMDGIVITDPAAIGASPSYYDFDAFEEMQITVGGADVTVQTGGVALNMVTHRGSNKISLGGRFYVTDSKFQAKNAEFVAEKKLEEPYFLGLNLINQNKDFGFQLGGPLIKDKAWLWGSYGVQDIKTTTVLATRDDTLLTNYAAKLNIQIVPENRFEAFIHSGAKEKWGRSTSTANPEGLYQGGRYHFGSPIIKFQDEHMFGDALFVSLKYAFSDAGFNLTPMTDLDFNQVTYWDSTDQRYYGNQAWRYYVERPVNQYNFLAQYYNDSFLGASHDIKIGFEYADRNAYTESVTPGNLRVQRRFTGNTWDWGVWGYGAVDRLPDPVPTAQFTKFKMFEYWRGYYRDYKTKALSGYFSDTITFGRFNLILGLRYDYQAPSVSPTVLAAVNDNKAWEIVDPALQTTLNTMLPGLEIAATTATYDNGVDGPGGPDFFWGVWSPRLGLTWDVTGDGKTIAKASFATYGDFMGMIAGYWMPYGAGGWIDSWWWDGGLTGTADGIVQANELYWHNIGGAQAYAGYRIFNDDGSLALTDAQWTNAYGSWWGGYDRTQPTLTFPSRSTWSEDSWGSSRTTEAMLTLEREIFTDFAVTVNATYRKYDHYDWGNKFFVDAAGERYGFISQEWYESSGTIGQTLNLVDRTGNPVTTTKWDGNTGEASQHEWYYTTNSYTEEGRTFDPSLTSAYTLYTNQPDRYNDYYSVDLIFTKRLSNKWMFDANFTWQHQAAYYGDAGYFDPTNIWAIDGKDYAAYMGGASGKINQYVYSRWMAKASGLYQLPYDINVSFVFLAREGWVIRERVNYVNYTLPNARSRSAWLYLNPFGEDRLNTFYRFDVRVEKMVRLGDTGKIWFMADIFNIFNVMLENRREQKDWGTYYYYGEGDARNYFVPQLNAYSLNELLNPRVLRVGIRFQF